MKKILFVFLIVGSFSALASELSEFERGYKEGLNNCSKDHAYACTISVDWELGGKSLRDSQGAESLTRGEAITKLAKACRTDKKPEFTNACVNQLREGKVKCFKL